MRRTLLIIAILIVVAGLGALAYFYFLSRSPSLATGTDTGGTLPISGTTTTPVGTSATTTVVTGGNGSGSRLLKISAGPVVPGEAVYAIPAQNASTTAETAVTFIERQSGNVYSYRTAAHTLTRTSNRTLPGIESAKWLPDGSVAYVQYLSGDDLSTVNTYALPSSGANGFFLPQDLSDIAVSSTSLLVLASGANGSTATVSHTDGSSGATAFSTALSSLRVAFGAKGRYIAFTKPSAALQGYAFSVDAAGRFSRIAGPMNGLVALPSPSGKWLFVSASENGALSTELINLTTSEVIPLPVATIADKCVWASDDSALYCGVPENPVSADYPDDWYQGAVHFSDRIWKIDVTGRYAQLILDFSNEEKNVSLDAEGLALDPALTTLVFVNKNDGSLWSYRL